MAEKKLKKPANYDAILWKKANRQQRLLIIEMDKQQKFGAGFAVDPTEDEAGRTWTRPYLGVEGGEIWNPGGYIDGKLELPRREGYMPNSHTVFQPGSVGVQVPGAAGSIDIDTSTNARPLYFEGDEYKVSGYDNIVRLQTKMRAANMYSSTAEYSNGVWGPDDILAYKSVLIAANSQAMSADQWLDLAIANPSMKVKVNGEDERAPLVITLTDPNDLKAVAKSAATALFGRSVKLPDEFMEQMITGFQQMQRERQIANYNAMESGGEVMDKDMSVSGYMTSEIEKRYPMQTQQDEFKSVMDNIMEGLFGGSQ